ncbi:hypothetical protein TCAL_04708 [Tigriopus californicus]|uniref:Uncharacterized protein n=1 Tax=Tigriopus californicus TaxID=6832 RepID=A0A553PT91_TIGCA|nr:hypothetical protein TCAL_04708 [Tigriopus californicus]
MTDEEALFAPVSESRNMEKVVFLSLLLLCGDIESNPGPPRRSVQGKTPSTEQKIESLSNTLAEYEAKITGLESELDTQKKSYDEKLQSMEGQLETISKDISEMKESKGEGVNDLKELIDQKLKEAEQKVEEVREVFEEFQNDYNNQMQDTADKFHKMDETVKDFQSVSDGSIQGILEESQQLKESFSSIDQRIKDIKIESSGKLQALGSTTRDQRREYKAKFVDLDVEFQRMKDRMEMLNMILDDMNVSYTNSEIPMCPSKAASEKMYEFEQSKKNNLIFYGVRNRAHENSDSLKLYLANLLRDHLNIRREVPIQRATRIHTGPEVRGCRPCLVTFETFKDRETVLRQSKALKKASIDVTEDLSKRTRESRQELRKFMRKIKRANPEKNCFLEYDKLYIDHKIFVYNDAMGQVVEQTESQRYGDMMSRPGTQMMMFGTTFGREGTAMGHYGGHGGLDDRYLGPSRPPSGMSTTGGRQMDRPLKSASAIPRLPPLNRNLSLSTGAMHQQGGFKDDKIDEMERMVVSYQEKLDTMATDYQEKVNILENKLADKEIEKPPFPLNGNHHNNDFSDYETDNEDDPQSPRYPLGPDSPLKNIAAIPEEDRSPTPNQSPSPLKELNGSALHVTIAEEHNQSPLVTINGGD